MKTKTDGHVGVLRLEVTAATNNTPEREIQARLVLGVHLVDSFGNTGDVACHRVDCVLCGGKYFGPLLG